MCSLASSVSRAFPKLLRTLEHVRVCVCVCQDIVVVAILFRHPSWPIFAQSLRVVKERRGGLQKP